MKPFPYDEFYPIFMEELKSLFSRRYSPSAPDPSQRLHGGNDAFLHGCPPEGLPALEPGSDSDSAAQGTLFLGLPQPFHTGRLPGENIMNIIRLRFS